MHVKFHWESFGYLWPMRLKWRYDFMHNSSIIYLSTGISETCHLFKKKNKTSISDREIITNSFKQWKLWSIPFLIPTIPFMFFEKECMRFGEKRDVQMSEFKHKILQKLTNYKIRNFFSMFINKYITWQHNGKIFTLTMYT